MNKIIVTPLVQELFKLYAEKHLGRELTKEEMKRILTFKGHRLQFFRNRYYRDMNKLIEEAIKEIGGTK